ncbi:MAG: hypothetical protein KF784_00720 [Fimbriimonadaceae bacterium]|nr:hypothetical protein [Fimbriimonadaceae bacterium]
MENRRAIGNDGFFVYDQGGVKMSPNPHARIWLIAARDKPLVVILRLKPSKHFHVMLWHTETGEIEHGSWFHGRLFAEHCALSPDGKFLLYSAMGATGDTWTGICKPPWLQTLCHWKESGTNFGYGGWQDSTTLVTHYSSNDEGFEMNTADQLPFIIIAVGDDNTDALSGGWIERPIPEMPGSIKPERVSRWQQVNHQGWEKKPSPNHPNLIRQYTTDNKNCSLYYSYQLEGCEGLLGPEVNQADWDSEGCLVVASCGVIQRYTLSDMNAGKPSFLLDLEPLAPPT